MPARAGYGNFESILARAAFADAKFVDVPSHRNIHVGWRVPAVGCAQPCQSVSVAGRHGAWTVACVALALVPLVIWSFMKIAVLIFVALTVVGLLVHLLCLRILRWRGITVERTKFGLALLFDTADEDGTPVRMLNVNGAFQSVAYVTDELWDELALEYQREQARIISELPQLRRVAVIGGGGFSLPKWLVTHLAPVAVSVVEIDEKIVEIARRSFGLDRLEREYAGTGRFALACDDGWAWLGRQDEPFELIVNEAFSGKKPLGPLTREEGARVVHEHLSEGGTYLATLRFPLEGRGSESMYETVRVFSREFAHVWLVPEFADEPSAAGNNTLVASDIDLVAAGCTPLAGFER